jgi:hypothetical protein
VVGSCKCSDEPLDCGATELISYEFYFYFTHVQMFRNIHSPFSVCLISTVFTVTFGSM